MSHFLPTVFKKEETFLRAVYPASRFPRFWNNGRITSAALKDRKGLSVDRTYDRSLSDAILYMREHFTGHIIELYQDACREANAVIIYAPSDNIFHCEIHGSEHQRVLDEHQAKIITNSSRVVFDASISVT